MLALPLLGAALLAGCAPEPEPAPTPTAAFASEEEAFAAAEEVYRAYLDAFNEITFEDPSSFQLLEKFTSGDYQSDERKQLSEMHAAGYVRGGRILIVDFRGTAYESTYGVSATTCNDVSMTTFIDAEGNDLVPADRPDRYALELQFVGGADSLKLSSAIAVEDATCTE